MSARSGNNPAALAIVCQDSGSAFALAAYCASSSAFRTRTICIGSAAGVFRNMGLVPDHAFDRDPSQDDADRLFEEINPDAVLLGTSFDSQTERRWCTLARERNIFSAALVDWWSNFGRRFSTAGTLDLAVLPDAVAVMDDNARTGCIADGVPGSLVHITGNPYWDYLVENGKTVAMGARSRLRRQVGIADHVLAGVIISSNIRNLDLHLGYDEADFFAAIRPLPERSSDGHPVAWFVKPHPKESRTALRELLNAAHLPIPLLDEQVSAIEAVAAADFVLGMCSSVLLEAALVGKCVVSLQPGLRDDKLRHLRIFDDLRIPKIVRAADAREVVMKLVNGMIQAPKPDQLPIPVGDGQASHRITSLLRQGIEARG